jgi:hypothetical protein
MTQRAPDSEEIAVVLIGSFNPAIFHPEWFLRQQILLQNEAEEAKVRTVSPEATQVTFLDLKLDVFPDRFMLYTADSSRAEKLQDIVLNVLNRLPHTPITACGINNVIDFDLNDEAYWHKIGHTLAPKALIWNDVLEMPGMANLVVKGVRKGDFPGDINVTVSPSRHSRMRHGISISSNFHYPVPQSEDGIPDSYLLTPYLNHEWKPALDQARKVAYQIFEKIQKDPS